MLTLVSLHKAHMILSHVNGAPLSSSIAAVGAHSHSTTESARAHHAPTLHVLADTQSQLWNRHPFTSGRLVTPSFFDLASLRHAADCRPWSLALTILPSCQGMNCKPEASQTGARLIDDLHKQLQPRSIPANCRTTAAPLELHAQCAESQARAAGLCIHDVDMRSHQSALSNRSYLSYQRSTKTSGTSTAPVATD